jgi:hypothetical protein
MKLEIFPTSLAGKVSEDMRTHFRGALIILLIVQTLWMSSCSIDTFTPTEDHLGTILPGIISDLPEVRVVGLHGDSDINFMLFSLMPDDEGTSLDSVLKDLRNGLTKLGYVDAGEEWMHKHNDQKIRIKKAKDSKSIILGRTLGPWLSGLDIYEKY